VTLFLSKLLPVFIYPLFVALLLAGISLAMWRFRRTARIALALSIAILWVASMPAFANWLYGGLEARYPAMPIEALVHADIAIVLGGAIGQPVPPRIVPDLQEASDRVLEAARLFRAGKVDQILVSAGNLPWLKSAKPEATLIGDLLVEFGVPRDAIVLETESRNTYENAINSFAIVQSRGWRTALLVTSAAHMPRALSVFKHAGINVVPVSTDVRVTYPLVENIFDFLPDAGSLARTTDAIKEIVGLFIYRARSWA
jgi:uncharacterized SAM-binding protein YcdF (DUF218 family)